MQKGEAGWMVGWIVSAILAGMLTRIQYAVLSGSLPPPELVVMLCGCIALAMLVSANTLCLLKLFVYAKRDLDAHRRTPRVGGFLFGALYTAILIAVSLPTLLLILSGTFLLGLIVSSILSNPITEWLYKLWRRRTFREAKGLILAIVRRRHRATGYRTGAVLDPAHLELHELTALVSCAHARHPDDPPPDAIGEACRRIHEDGVLLRRLADAEREALSEAENPPIPFVARFPL